MKRYNDARIWQRFPIIIIVDPLTALKYLRIKILDTKTKCGVEQYLQVKLLYIKKNYITITEIS